MSLKSYSEPMHSNPEEPLQPDARVDGVSEGMCLSSKGASRNKCIKCLRYWDVLYSSILRGIESG
jgi:hypothetical protein